MRDIFSDLYDKVLSFFVTQNTDESKLVAKNRLRTVLMQDRVGFSERAMQMLRDDLIENISKYLEIDTEAFDLSIDAKEDTTVLNLSIPVLRSKTDEEIDEAIAIQEKARLEKTHEIVGELQELVKEKAQELAQSIGKDEDSEEKKQEEEEVTKEVQGETEEEIEEVQEEEQDKKDTNEKK